MIDHAGFGVNDYDRSVAFYSKVLAPLGIKLFMEATPEQTESGKRAAGFGDERPWLWFAEGQSPGERTHIALEAPNHRAVDDFYRLALEAGAKDNGPPGPRDTYGPHYYAAFVIDPEGNNLEAVCRTPE